MRIGRTGRAHSGRGSVLLLVVGLLTIIAMLGCTFLVVSRLYSNQAEGVVERTNADLLAQSIVASFAAVVKRDLAIDDNPGDGEDGPYRSSQNSYPRYATLPWDNSCQYLGYDDGTLSHISNIVGTGTQVDLDGDGRMDAYLVETSQKNLAGKSFSVAARILDPSGMVCINTAGNGNWPTQLKTPACVNLAAVVGASLYGTIHNADYPRKSRAPAGQTLDQYYSNAGSRLLSPVAALPFAFTDEMHLRSSDTVVNRGRLFNALSVAPPTPLPYATRKKLTTYAVSRSLMRKPNLYARSRIKLRAKENDPLRIENLRKDLAQELTTAVAGIVVGGGGGGGYDPPVYGDNSSGICTRTGNWANYAGYGYSGNINYTGQASVAYWGPSSAKWTFNSLLPGKYKVSMTWTADPAYASNAPYRIYDGATVIANGTFSERVPPQGLADPSGMKFQELGGPYSVTTGTLAVETWNATTDAALQIDCVRIEREIPPTFADAGPEAWHFVTNLWTALEDYAPGTSKAQLLPDGKKIYGVTYEPYITEIYARAVSDAAETPKRFWGAAIELYNPYPVTIKLSQAGSHQYKMIILESGGAVGAELDLAGDIPSKGRAVFYDFGCNDPAAPIEQTRLFGFPEPPGAGWTRLSGLKVAGGRTVRLVRVAEGTQIPVDSVLPEDVSLPDDNADYAKDLRRDDTDQNGRYCVAIYHSVNQSVAFTDGPSHKLNEANSVATDIPTTTLRCGYGITYLFGMAPNSLANLDQIHVAGPEEKDMLDLPHALAKQYDKDWGRGKLNLAGRASGAPTTYPDVPWGCLVGEMFELNDGDLTRHQTASGDDPTVNGFDSRPVGTRIYGRININTATPEILSALPFPPEISIGAIKIPVVVANAVKAITDYRDALSSAGRSNAAIGCQGVRSSTAYRGFLTPGEVAIPLAFYADSLIRQQAPTAVDSDGYIAARDSLYESVCNTITVNTDVFAAHIQVRLDTLYWDYIVVLDRSCCFKLTDSVATLLFTPVSY